MSSSSVGSTLSTARPAEAWPYDGPPPRYATQPTPGRRNSGARIERVAAAMGRPLMPWQSYVARVGTELLPSGEYAYQVVVVTVPRQSGKTTLLVALGIERCMTFGSHRFLYTAQTGKDARDRWNDGVKLVQGSPLNGLVRVRRSQGSERMELPNGSEWRVFAPTMDALHGSTPHTVCLDEAFALSQQLGDALMGAIGPAQITLRDRQLWIVSTMGTAESTFLQAWIDRGRDGADRVALFDWGAGDDVRDILDPASWPTFHPALGLDRNNGITTDAIAAEAARLPRAEFERAYGNRRTATTDSIIEREAWAQLGFGALVDGQLVDHRDPPPGRIVLSYDVAHDRASSVVLASWRDRDGTPQGKVVRWAPGTSWVASAVAEWATRWNVGKVAAAGSGPTREVTAELRQLRALELADDAEPLRVAQVARDVVELNTGELAVSWGELLTGVEDATFGHDGSPLLADAAAVVTTRPLNDASLPSRSRSAGDISPLVALMVGMHVLRDLPDAAPSVVVRFAS